MAVAATVGQLSGTPTAWPRGAKPTGAGHLHRPGEELEARPAGRRNRRRGPPGAHLPFPAFREATGWPRSRHLLSQNAGSDATAAAWRGGSANGTGPCGTGAKPIKSFQGMTPTITGTQGADRHQRHSGGGRDLGGRRKRQGPGPGRRRRHLQQAKDLIDGGVLGCCGARRRTWRGHLPQRRGEHQLHAIAT